MILTNYYCFKKSDGKSKTRYDEIASTGDFEYFEKLRNKSGDLFVYLLDESADYLKCAEKRKPDWKLSKGTHISHIAFKLNEHPSLALGDIRESESALIFRFNAEFTEFEIFIAKGYRSHRHNIFIQFSEHEFNAEIEVLLSKSKPIK